MNLGRCKSQPANVPALPLNNVMRNCLANQAGSKNTIKNGLTREQVSFKIKPIVIYKLYSYSTFFLSKGLLRLWTLYFILLVLLANLQIFQTDKQTVKHSENLFSNSLFKSTKMNPGAAGKREWISLKLKFPTSYFSDQLIVFFFLQIGIGMDLQSQLLCE